MLYNNVKAMMHLQGHIDSEKQQNLDLSDLTQCKHCYKQFDTPFEMQTHIEKVHLNNLNVLMCRICEKDHDTRSALTSHMKQNHCACEMPYVCQLCSFRSSMYSDVVDHFKKKHDSSNNMLCLYCLRVFHVKFVSQGWGQTQSYYHHLLRHQSKTNNRKCTFCKLSFFNAQDLKSHRKTNHQPNQKGVIGASAKYSTPDQVMIKVPEAGLQPKKSSGPKSLNAPTVAKVKEHRGLRFPRQAATNYCFECKMLMSTADHYKKYIQCSMCRFATSCSFAYASHMMGFHSGQVSSLSTNVPWERPMPAPLFCLCGFSSKFGNKIANHLVFCSKRTCYLVKPEASLMEKQGQDEQTDPRRKPGASILDVLGLVKKQSLVSTTDEDEAGAGATDEAQGADEAEPVTKPASVDEENKDVSEKSESVDVDNEVVGASDKDEDTENTSGDQTEKDENVPESLSDEKAEPCGDRLQVQDDAQENSEDAQVKEASMEEGVNEEAPVKDANMEESTTREGERKETTTEVETDKGSQDTGEENVPENDAVEDDAERQRVQTSTDDAKDVEEEEPQYFGSEKNEEGDSKERLSAPAASEMEVQEAEAQDAESEKPEDSNAKDEDNEGQSPEDSCSKPDGVPEDTDENRAEPEDLPERGAEQERRDSSISDAGDAPSTDIIKHPEEQATLPAPGLMIGIVITQVPTMIATTTVTTDVTATDMIGTMIDTDNTTGTRTDAMIRDTTIMGDTHHTSKVATNPVTVTMTRIGMETEEAKVVMVTKI
nr:hypothetical protein BaRGS_000027 [Batillaria attramentaria]